MVSKFTNYFEERGKKRLNYYASSSELNVIQHININGFFHYYYVTFTIFYYFIIHRIVHILVKSYLSEKCMQVK